MACSSSAIREPTDSSTRRGPMSVRSFFLPALLLLMGACTDSEDVVDTGSLSDCDPVAPTQCGLPFPSTFYMVADTNSETGWRVNLGATTMPMNANDVQPDPWTWNERDGWAVFGPVMAHFPEMSLTGVSGHDDIGSSLLDTSPILIIDADTGERIPHFAELDMSHDDDAQRMLMIYPAIPLDYATRYLIAIRGLVDASGDPIEPSEGFAALRDGTATDDGDVELRRDYLESSVFAPLESGGVSRDELLLAWDFVTGSKEGITGKARWMRDDLYDRIDAGEMSYEITEVEDLKDDAHTARRVFGEMTVPLYTEEDYRGSLLTRGDDGMPYHNGTTTVEFTVIIPNSVMESGEPVAVLQYGHGLLGRQAEVESSYLAELADTHGYVLIAVDWTGMKNEDFDAIVVMMVDGIDRFGIIPERSQQGFVEFLAAMRLITGDLASDDALMAPDPVTGEPVSVIDPEKRYYYGNSQGGVLGGAYAALSPDIERAVLGVSGTPYGLLLLRSVDFTAYFLILQTMYPEPLHVAMWMGYMQTLWDSAESSGYATAMNSDPLQDTPAKEVLLQVAIGDAQVTTLGAHNQARAYGAVLIETPAREVWGLPIEPSGTIGSALVEWDYGLYEPYENLPPDGDTDPHGRPRKEPEAMEQLDTFLRTGAVVNTCDGVCEN